MIINYFLSVIFIKFLNNRTYLIQKFTMLFISTNNTNHCRILQTETKLFRELFHVENHNGTYDQCETARATAPPTSLTSKQVFPEHALFPNFPPVPLYSFRTDFLERSISKGEFLRLCDRRQPAFTTRRPLSGVHRKKIKSPSGFSAFPSFMCVCASCAGRRFNYSGFASASSIRKRLDRF